MEERREGGGMKAIKGTCSNCDKRMTSRCDVFKEQNKRPGDDDWCYGWRIKKKERVKIQSRIQSRIDSLQVEEKERIKAELRNLSDSIKQKAR